MDTFIRLLTIILALVVGSSMVSAGQRSSTQNVEHNESVEGRFPGEDWMQYADVSEAGFSPERLAGAKRFWEKRDASAFLAVSGGVVVAS